MEDVKKGKKSLMRRISPSCLLPTHNTSEAMEAAGAYGFALRSAFHGSCFEEIIEAAMRGGERLVEFVEEINSAPSSRARIREIIIKSREMEESQLMDWLHEVLGNGLSSADVCGAVFGAFAMAGGDVFKAICMGASMGGDTDTIAALAGALSAAFVGNHNIPGKILENVKYPNYLSRLFKKEMNISINSYIIEKRIEKRIEKARILLEHSDMPVHAVSMEVEYNNFSYFTKLFREKTGLTPNEYRKEKIK